MALNFGKHPDVVFDHAPLTLVLCQVRFPPVLSLMTAAGVTGFQTALRNDYPKMLPTEQSTTIEIAPGGLGVNASAPVWRFTDDEGRWTVGLAADFVSLETPSYTYINDFLSRFDRILHITDRTVMPSDSLRIGFRKVNSLDADGVNTSALRSVVRPEMLGPLGLDELPAPISGAASQLQFADDDNTLVVRYGLSIEQQGGFHFLIDMDYFTERPRRVAGGDDITNLLRHFSDGMTSFFHWAIEGEHKEKLGPRPRDEKVRT